MNIIMLNTSFIYVSDKVNDRFRYLPFKPMKFNSAQLWLDCAHYKMYSAILYMSAPQSSM